ncbi:AMP-binding protein [Wenyingzhuangia sp. IMCC45467]
MHKSFQLQGQSFEDIEELISFSETISEELYQFLCLWFGDDEFLTVQTSGSTGTPKPIKIKKEFMKNSAKATGTFFNLGAATKALCCLSVNYIAGKMMVIRALELGWNLDFIEPVSNPLEDAFDEYDFCAMVPMQVQNSLWDLHLVKNLLIGGGVVSQSLQENLQSLSTQCFASYGMTETVTHIAIRKLNYFKDATLTMPEQNISTPLDDQVLEDDSNSKSLIQNDVVSAQSDEQNRKVTKDEVFEHSREADTENELDIRTKTNNVYQLLPNITISQDDRDCLVIDAPLLSDEKIITNDIIKQYSATEFEWLGRYDNVINSGGVKLHPEQIEKELSKVITQRFFVTGIADETLGEKLILVIEGENKEYDFNTLSLSKYEIPKHIYFVNEFVETETKKIQRKKTLDLISL